VKRSLFPYDRMRPSQREFYAAASSAIRRKRILLAHVPTGIGKTAAVLTAALENAGGRKVLFLTARRSQHRVVIETMEEIDRKKEGGNTGCVSIIARREMCINPSATSSSDHAARCRELVESGRCPYYREFKRKRESLLEELSGMALDVERLMLTGEEQGICPYYLALEVAKRADMVVADYNQIFSYRIRESFLMKLGLTLDNTILVVDEAHNLPNRIRNTLVIRPEWGLRAVLRKENREEGKGCVIQTALEVLDRLATMFPEKEEQIRPENATALCRPILFETGRGEEKEMPLQTLSESEGLFRPEVEGMLSSLQRFLSLWCDETAHVVRFAGPRGPYLKVMDVRPSASPVFSSVSSAILMSGTLHPGRFYRDVLGIPPDRARIKRFGWPFPPENRRIFIIEETTTKYTERTEEMYQRSAEIIEEVVNSIPGNTAAFFPSYEVLSQVERLLHTERMEARLITERRGMSGRAVKRALNTMRREEGILLLAVQSGSMAEGLDYSGSALSGVIVVGLPVPPPDPERIALQSIYSEMFGRNSGFRYAFLQPAVNRVIQSAGRLIRGEEEKGVIVLMDHRFSARRIKSMLPRDFRPEITETVGRDCTEAFREWQEAEETP